MADNIKNRNGSIIVYGPFQANTENNYVAYTDGIAHEKTDGSVVRLNNLLDNLNLNVDTELSTTSVNAIANNVVTENLNSKQDKLTAGANIIIENNVISATGGGGTGSNVIPNATLEGTEQYLNSLKIDTTTFKIDNHVHSNKSVLNQLTQETLDAISANTSAIATIQSQLAEHVRTSGFAMETLTDNISSLEDAVDSIATSCGTNSDDIEVINTEITSIKNTIDVGLQEQILNHETRISVLEAGGTPGNDIGFDVDDNDILYFTR